MEYSHSSAALRRFNHLFSETHALYRDAETQLGLSDSVMQILYTIIDYGGPSRCPLQIVCRRTGLCKQTINSALRKLEADGMVYLEQTGRKTKDVCLTERGIALAEDTVLQIIQAENAIFASWPPEDVERYLELTERYLLAFKAETAHLQPKSQERTAP